MNCRIYTAVLLFAFLASCGEAASSKVNKSKVLEAKMRDADISMGGAVIQFDRTEYDFGTITEGTIVEGSFSITNVGKSDLVITNAHATCGCTVPKWPREAIKPGETAPMTFAFNSLRKPGKQNKSITLQTNTANVFETLRIKGLVLPKEK
ncbi:MAG: DUF1573 domain-containing protein [Lutibacter sp.]|jgi:hypothetical protein|nr:DUF1573 domain-containing protein [Lutibacter sp.]